jgi:serine/threonine protein kinase
VGDLSPNAVVDRYRVQRKLGQGGMGSVYRVQDLDTGEIRAMKVVHPEAADRFLTEARALAALNHPNVIRFHGIWPMPDGTFALLMDYVVGSDLQRLVGSGAATQTDVIVSLHDAALGLDYCHSKDVVHRDIKPANIMVAGEGHRTTALVVDFGLGKDRRLGLMKTQRDEVAGTLPFISPEQWNDFSWVGASADQWSLAVTAWYCLSGKLPFPEAPYSYEIAKRLTASGPGLPAEIDAIFDRAFQPDPRDRFETCIDLTRVIGAAFGLALPTHATSSRRPAIKEPIRPLVPDYDISSRHSDPLWGFSSDRLSTRIRRVAASRGDESVSVQGVAIRIRVRVDSLVVDLPGRHPNLPRLTRQRSDELPDPRIHHLEALGWRSPQGPARPWSLAVPISHDPSDAADRVLEALDVGFGVAPEKAYKDL